MEAKSFLLGLSKKEGGGCTQLDTDRKTGKELPGEERSKSSSVFPPTFKASVVTSCS